MACELNVILDGSPEKLLDVQTPGLGSVTEKIEEIETDISSVKDNVGKKADALINTASGAVASFTDGADDLPIKQATFGIEPNQNLHGYEHPWIGGAEKNKLDDVNPIQLNNCSNNNGTITATIDDTRSFSPVLQLYNNNTYIKNVSRNGNSFTFEKDNTFNRIVFGHSGATKDAKVIYDVSALIDGIEYVFSYNVISTSNKFSWNQQMIRLATETDATFAPYENICPISGWTGMNIEQRGKNLFVPIMGRLMDNGTISSSLTDWHSDFISVGDHTQLTLTILEANSNYTAGSVGACFWDADMNTISVYNFVTMNAITAYPFTVTREIPNGAKIFAFRGYQSGSTTQAGIESLKAQIEFGSASTDYETPNKAKIPITFPTSAGTVYGGNVVINEDGSGVLTVDHVAVDMGTLTWGGNADYFYNTSQPIAKANGLTNIIADCYQTSDIASASSMPDGSIRGIANSKNIYIKDTRYTTGADLKTALSGHYCCYEVASPTTYNLTADQISTLLGVNNIWCDTGDSEVVYIVDPTSTNVKITEDISDLKDNLSTIETGVSENATVGNALQLASNNYVEDQVPYLFRKTGGNKEAGNRAYLDKIVGGTVNWNQLANTVRETKTLYGLQMTNIDDVSASIIGTTTQNSALQISREAIPLVKDHVYFVPIVSGFTGTSTNRVTLSGVLLTGYNGGMFKNTKGYSECYVRLDFYADTVFNITDYKHQVFDLTAMFGTTIADYLYSLETASAGSGIAKLREWGFNFDEYHEYNPGTLKSVEGLQSHDTVGFNQWDEEWELGYISGANGQNANSNTCIRSKNYIPVISSLTYYFHIGDHQTVYTRFYDVDKNFVGGSYATNTQFPILNNARYMRFFLADAYGAVYKNDICINISDPARNGQYEPYKKRSYPLDSTKTLRGILKLDANNNLYFDGDEYYPSEGISRRYTIVDLGTLNWTYRTDTTKPIFQASLSNNAKQGTTSVVGNYICQQYVSVTSDAVSREGADKGIAISADGWRVYVQDSSYTNATAFKTAMSSVYLLYELATPTTETAEPYQTPQIVDEYGTEEFVSTGIIPVGHVTRYPTNQVKKLDGLPSNFSTLIAPTEKTTTASQNYAVGSYLILNNQLYKVTSAISSGATITPGTNCTATTIMAELLALA